MRGTWQTTSGGFDGILQVVLIVGAAAGLAVVVVEFAWLIITLGVAAVAVRLWLLHRKNAALAMIHATGIRLQEEQQARDDAALASRRRHEIEVARASAPVVNVNNTVDPAALIAAALNVQQPYTAQAQPARVIRGEVEK